MIRLEECAVSYVTREEVPERFVPEPDVDYYEWHCVAIGKHKQNNYKRIILTICYYYH